MQTTDPRHGQNAGYQAGCREACCKTAHASTMAMRRKRAYITGASSSRSALGTQRRIRALMAIGWRQQDIAAAGGWTDKTEVRDILKRERVHILTARRVERVYSALSMKRGPSSSSREYAVRKGWAPPLAWDNIDDSNQFPIGLLNGREVKPKMADPLIVAAVIDGARRPEGISIADRRQVIRELMAAGHLTRAEIALRCGISLDVLEMDIRRSA